MSREYDDLRADLDSTLRELERVKVALANAVSERDRLRRSLDLSNDIDEMLEREKARGLR